MTADHGAGARKLAGGETHLDTPQRFVALSNRHEPSHLAGLGLSGNVKQEAEKQPTERSRAQFCSHPGRQGS